MPAAYRIVKARYKRNAFDGEGARLQGGRWSSAGTRIVYTAGSMSLAVLEILVHLQQAELLSSYVVVKVEFPDDLVLDLDPTLLPQNWRVSPAPTATRALGDKWVSARSSAVLRVPSVIVPSEHNFLLNPDHEHFPRVTIGEPATLDVDPRILKR